MTALEDCGLRFVKSDHEDWDRYVCQHPKGAVFHTAAMVRALAATRGIEPYARAAIDAEGRIVALLVSCYVKTLEMFAPVSSRAVQYAEPLCDPNSTGLAALTELIRSHDEFMRSRALLCEVRTICEPGLEKDALLANGYEHRDYVNYVVTLRPDVDGLWKNLDKRLRQKIRGSFRKGIVVRDDNTPDGIARLYGLLQASYRRARIPLPDEALFMNTLVCLPQGSVRVRTAYLDQVPVASIISLVFCDRVFSWFGGTVRLRGLSPFACIVWDDIKWSCENDYRYYDFGGAGWPEIDYGPRRFKAHFGGEEVRYGRYILTYSNVRLKLAEIGFRISRRFGVWS